MMPESTSFCLRSARLVSLVEEVVVVVVVVEEEGGGGGSLKPRTSGRAWVRPSSMALMARKTSSLTVLMMSSNNVCPPIS